MRSVLVAGSVLLLSGCLTETRFVDDFVDAECEFLMSCYDEAILNFKGWETYDDCVATEGTRVVTEAEGCAFDRRAGADCIQAMKDATCPADPATFELPAICDQVFADCPVDDDTDDTDDETEADDPVDA